MNTLNERIKELEAQVKALTDKVWDLSRNTESKLKNPTSIVGGNRDRSLIKPTDVDTGLAQLMGGTIPWNDSEIKTPKINTQPSTPVKGYNKHSHSQFSGGPLIKDVLEIVEYDWGSITNKHCQQYWNPQPNIATEVNSNNKTVPKIGQLDLVFNPDTLTWGTIALEIDIKKCYLVERDDEGNIAVDSKGQQKRSPFYNEDTTKTSIIWDESGNCWRFLAVYAEGN